MITNDMEATPDDAERPSKTELKRQMHALQALGEQLVELSHDQFARLDLPDELREAVEFAHRVKGHEARRRHMQYLGKLMRHADAECDSRRSEESHRRIARRSVADASGRDMARPVARRRSTR